MEASGRTPTAEEGFGATYFMVKRRAKALKLNLTSPQTLPAWGVPGQGCPPGGRAGGAPGLEAPPGAAMPDGAPCRAPPSRP